MSTSRWTVLGIALLLPIPCQADAGSPSALHRAARLGNSEEVLRLVADGDAVDALDAAGMTPLHVAARQGEADTVRVLLAAGADVAARDASGRTPLHYAALAGRKHVLEALLERGATVEARDAHGDSPLHLAAHFARVDALGVLLAAGADVRAVNAVGQTPLHVLGLGARESDDLAMQDLFSALAEVLIAAGAEPQALDAAGTPAWPRRPEPRGAQTPPGYPTYDQIVSTLQNRAAQYPAICQAVNLGPSSTNKDIWALRITDNPGVEEDEPEFKYISTMHGDEVTGVVMCLNLSDYLLTNYSFLERVSTIVNNADIWIVPCMNPYGYINNTRYNATGMDLNRSFPEGSTGEPNTINGRPKEVQTIMLWSFAQSFTLAANFHGGALVVNYPFDNDGQGSQFSPTPDEDMFVWISEEYSQHNLPMWNSSEFYHGITNGAAWYAISGGMQDWDYRYMGGNEVTIELGNTKSPPYSQMPTYWDNNRESMLSYLETVFVGVRGVVTDANTGAPLAATVQIVGRDHNVYTDPDVGDYHRMLLPGAYQVRFSATGYDTVTLPVTVNSGAATRLDVQMGPSARITYPDGGETLTVNVPATVTWIGNPTAQFHVQQTANYGETGSVSDDFERTSLGANYTTGGNANLAISSTSSHSPTRSAKAGTISHNQQSWMKRTLSGSQVSFWYRVSSESGYDFFNFYVDGDRKVHASGTVNWTQFATAVPAGPHELKWEYAKDNTVSYGSDTAWVDDLLVTTDLTSWTDIIALTAPGATSVAWTPTQTGTTNKVRVRAYYGGGSYGTWDESNGLFTVQEGPQYPLGDANCDGVLDFDDINPFVLALSDPSAYQAAYPGCPLDNSDCNQDGIVNFDDINAFVALLGG